MKTKICLVISGFFWLAPVHASQEQTSLSKFVGQLVKAGEITMECARSEKKASDLISVETIKLREKGADMLVTGQNCACVGARVCQQWLFQLTGEEPRLIFGPSQADGIKPLTRITNGYKDIKETYIGGGGWTGVYRFNGTKYVPNK